MIGGLTEGKIRRVKCLARERDSSPTKLRMQKKEERDSEEGEVGDPRQAGQFMRVRQESEQAGKSVRSLLFFFFLKSLIRI